jgi:hypothetical protein
MEIVLAPESAARIRAVLGGGVDLSPPAVPEALARLANEAPDVYSQVLDDLSGCDIRLDSERALHRRHRRSALRRLLFGWAEYESDAGDRVVAKRRVAAAVPIGLAGVLLLAAGLAGVVHRHHRVPPQARASAHRAARRPVFNTAALGRAIVHAAPVWSRPASDRAAFAAPMPVRPVPALPVVPPFPVAPIPVRQGADGPPPSIVFTRTTTPAAAPVQPTGGPPLPPIVYDRSAAANTPGSLSARADGTGAPAEGSATAAAGNGGAPRKPGDRIAAHLLTGILVASGVPAVPVVAQGSEGTVWLGRATAEADGRVHVSFSTPSAGVALDPEKLAPGLPARLITRRRAAAAAAIGAVAQAAADYTQAVARAGQISVAQGTAQITVGGAGPAWTYAASRLADALSPQAGGTIETLDVPAGSSCVILITGAP